MSNKELQKPIFPLVPGEKVPAKNAVGFSDPVNYEKLRSLCKPGENYGLLMGKNTGLFCLDFDLYKSGKKYTLENFKEQFGENDNHFTINESQPCVYRQYFLRPWSWCDDRAHLPVAERSNR